METLRAPADVKELQRCLNDLVAILALPSLWTELQPSQIASTLVDALIQLLSLEFAYIRLVDAEGRAVTECARTAMRLDVDPEFLRPQLERGLAPMPPEEPLVRQNPVGDGMVRTAVFRLGLHHEVGRLVVGCRREDFPTSQEKLLIRVATNQVVVGLQEAQRLAREKRAAQEIARALERERVARLEAEKATQLRDDVLAIIAHDLRNPMHTIDGAAQLIEITTDDESRRRSLGIIHRASHIMQGLVNDLLDVARMEAGNLVLKTEPVDIATLVREAVELFQTQATERRIELAVAADDALSCIQADRGRLLQVISNLIGNALKFSRPDTTITARAGRGEGCIRVSIEDAGVGIAAENLERVFDRFWQADRASRAGAGLGLAICRNIVAAHGGRIWAESAEGRGTTMYFELPEVRGGPHGLGAPPDRRAPVATEETSSSLASA